MKRRKRRPHGFTLLEVLLVLTILVILGSTVTVYYSKTQSKANEKIATVQILAIGQLLDQYHIDIGSYPSTSQGLAALHTAPGDLSDSTKWSGYAENEIAPDPWSRPYQYKSEGDSFEVWSFGVDGQDGTDDDVKVQ
ncbi:MAG: type II secretion system major pseudopilin GspG [Planctomycetota bacterium]|nr:type II secretion system major pseudopilin GspG [Planctomycetota bacterium]